MELSPHLLRAIGDSDCERLGTGALVQPVNAVTSLAYVAIGVAIAIFALGAGVERGRSALYASCVAAVGVGSVLFHGPQPAGSRLLHDLPIVLTVLFIVVRDLRLVVGLPSDLVVFAAAAIGSTALGLVSIEALTVVTGVGVVAVAVLELSIFRRRLRPVTGRRQVRAYVAIIGVAATAATAWLLGRTSSPACDPDGAFQFHGVWHVVSAFVFGLWWWLAMWLPGRPAVPAREQSQPVITGDRAER